MKSLRIFAHIDQDSFDNPIRMPSVAEINAFADSIGVKFPDEYVLFIKKYAGHFIHYDVGITVKDVLPNGQYILS